MYLTLKKALSLFVLYSALYISCHAQNSGNLLFLSQISNRNRIKMIDSHSYFKIKTNAGDKIKGKFSIVAEDYFVSTKGDTIYINEIEWIKAKRQLAKWEKATATAALFSGIYFSFGTVPAAFIILAMEGNAWIILAPVVTISAAIIGFRTLGGRRYNLKIWKLESKCFSGN
jgi:hypothetical protein